MKLPQFSSQHDVIAIGGSAGCFDVIRELLRSLPADLPAAVLITTHLAPSVSLMNILKGFSSLSIKEAVSGEALRRGQVYLAVPDTHLLVHDRHILVRRGPRENLSRPAIDPLFRSVACALGSRVIGVLLSGGLNDGTAGLAAIQRCGGITVVQDPQDAQVPSMPQSALRALEVDHCVDGSELGSLLLKLVQEPPGETPAISSELQLEVAIAAQEVVGMEVTEKLGEKSPFTCPDCDGVLWQVHDADVMRFRCHIGHAMTAETMLEQKGEAADAILGRLLRIHEERAALARKLAARAGGPSQIAMSQHFERRAAGYEEDASLVRALMSKVAEHPTKD